MIPCTCTQSNNTISARSARHAASSWQKERIPEPALLGVLPERTPRCYHQVIAYLKGKGIESFWICKGPQYLKDLWTNYKFMQLSMSFPNCLKAMGAAQHLPTKPAMCHTHAGQASTAQGQTTQCIPCNCAVLDQSKYNPMATLLRSTRWISSQVSRLGCLWAS